MVYTEYFARGTEPTEYCDMHSATSGGVGTLAGVFQEQPAENTHAPAPIGGSSVTAGPPRPMTTGTATTPIDQVAPPPPEPKRKGGFWSRILGRGRDRKKN